jgi:prepilin-type processing-associated H-X9-DG protein
MRVLCTSILVVLFAPMVCLGQALADRLPGDAQIYVGWSGTDSLGPGFDQSHLKAVLDASQFSQFLHDSLPQWTSRIGGMNPQFSRLVRQVTDLLSAAAQHPTAFYFGGLGAANAGGPPIPQLAIVCDGGADAPKIEQQVRRLLERAQGPGLNLRVIGTLVVVSDFVFPEHIDNPLSQNAGFQAAMGQLGKDPVLAMYVDGTATVATIDAAIQQLAPPQAKQLWPQIRDALGLGGLKTAAMTAGFDGKNWSQQAMAAAPAPRKGLLALADAAPLAPEIFKLIPDSSTMAGAGSCDFDALFTQIDQAVVQFAPDQGNRFHQVLAQVNQTLGLDVQKDLLAALGAQWGYYVDPTTAGNGLLGCTIINRPRNADQLQTSLNTLESLANNMIRQAIQRGQGGGRGQLTLHVEFRQLTSNGTSVHYLATPLISPSWAIKDGTLYIGLYPQMVVSAVNRPADAKSIQDNPDFQAVIQKLNAPAAYSSFSFIDLPKTMPNGYQGCLAMSRLYFGLGDLFGAQSPPLIMPPLDKIMAETEPAGCVSWGDDAGFYFKSIEPFPGASAIGSADSISAAGVGETAMLASVLLPALSKAREQANVVKCMSNLRQIGQGLIMYASDHQGNLPPDLGTLVKTAGLTAMVFVCPSARTHPPGQMTPDQLADWVNANSDYIYIGANVNLSHVMAERVVCYEKDDDHGGKGMNLLFADGHVEFMPLEAAHQAINNSIKPR